MMKKMDSFFKLFKDKVFAGSFASFDADTRAEEHTNHGLNLVLFWIDPLPS